VWFLAVIVVRSLVLQDRNGGLLDPLSIVGMLSGHLPRFNDDG
jgi:hypothetical protein